MKKPNIFQILIPIISLCTGLGATVNLLSYYKAEQYNLALFFGVMVIVWLGIAALFGLPVLFYMNRLKLYVYKNRTYKRVVGPAELFTSVGGFGGHVVIGDKFKINTVFFAGKNSLSNTSINGFSIDEMELTPIDEGDRKTLGLRQSNP